MKISTKLTTSNIEKMGTLLRETPARLGQFSAGMSVDALCTPLSSGEWSLTEVLAHLISCAELSSSAIYLALLLDRPTGPYVHPTRQWNALLRYEQLPFADLLHMFALRRTVLLHTLDELSESQWARVFQHEGKRPATVYTQARTIALHEQAHCELLTERFAETR